MLRRIYDSLLAVAFPRACLVCGKITENERDGIACDACWRNTPVFAGGETLCVKCSQYLRAGPPSGEAFCHRCDDHFYEAARAVGLYEFALAASVLSLKTEPFIATRLETLICDAFDGSPFYDADLIVPVPLSKRRRIERGFNQADVPASVISRHAGIEIDRLSLVRTVHTPMHRAAMDRRSRETTVEKAFAVTRPKLVEGRSVLLVDDVFTSGATVSACANVLKRAGARKVCVLTIARAR